MRRRNLFCIKLFCSVRSVCGFCLSCFGHPPQTLPRRPGLGYSPFTTVDHVGGANPRLRSTDVSLWGWGLSLVFLLRSTHEEPEIEGV